MTMTSDAKQQLSRTIRGLRERLLEDLRSATDAAYRMSVRAQDAGLSEAARAKRRRLEQWMEEQVRAQPKKAKQRREGEDFRRDAEKQAAYTLLNRLVMLRLLEASELRKPKVVTGGWESRGYLDYRQLAPAMARRAPGIDDDSEGYAFLLQLVFEDLAHELPGLFGPAGVAELVPVPAGTLRHVIEALDEPVLASCWTDEMTLGWVYQYWNDPEREALDAKLNSGGKVEPHEIASKTQMFTERYMVDWLLQNSLGPMWLAMCKKNGWTPECESEGTLAALEARRAEWREKREAGPEAGGVELTALMPLESDAERRWAYYVPQPIPDDAVEHAPATVRDLRVLDPAVGSGHFLVVAFDLLFALYQEEARHRSIEVGDDEGDARWSDAAIVERILEHNLHGIDLDPRAVQIAAAALWLQAQKRAPDADPATLNLVASNLNLAALPDDDPALVELRAEVERETGIPEALTQQVVEALRGADHLGSLLKVDAAIEEAFSQYELSAAVPSQGDLYDGYGEEQRRPIEADAAKASVIGRLHTFLEAHGGHDDLGLRLKGEQLARGVRFLHLVQEGRYDLVVGNPPYQGTSKLANAAYIKKQYPKGKADLYAAFLERGLELVCRGGVSALLTMRGWMFIKQYSEIRQWLLETYDLRALHDLSSGAFEEISAAQVVVSVVTSVFAKTARTESAVALKVFDNETVTDVGETQRKRAATLCHVGRHEFDPAALKVVPEWPLVYWWSSEWIATVGSTPSLGEVADVRQGITTTRNAWFIRKWWELATATIYLKRAPEDGVTNCFPPPDVSWAPIVMGGSGRKWFEPLVDCIAANLSFLMLEVRWEYYRLAHPALQSKPREWFFRGGMATSKIGSEVNFRTHRYASAFSDAGQSALLPEPPRRLTESQRTSAKAAVSDMNPSVNFQVSDLKRLPLLKVEGWRRIYQTLEAAFSASEAAREQSVEFSAPGPNAWACAVEWGQRAVDRADSLQLPPFAGSASAELDTDHISFALGVALGRFGRNGEGVLDPDSLGPDHAFTAGILFLDGSLDENDLRDSLGHAHAAFLRETWDERGADIDPKSDLRSYLRLKFFDDVHRTMYENRPIHWPLSSAKKTFVAWINIHRWDAQTLRVLLAEHLRPAEARIEGQLADVRAARDGADEKAAKRADNVLDRVMKHRQELKDFIALVTQCAEEGPPPADKKHPQRERDARYDPVLDDGVMINSAALWPLLEPQWKKPKAWWKELCNAKGRKDYDWSHLAMRYFPNRVDAKCQEDPSLGVAHGCFWRYHPERAWAWELRLQDEIEEGFRIEEAPYDPPGLEGGPTGDEGDAAHRARYLEEHPDEALAAVEKETLRRRGRGKDSQPVAELRLLEPGLWSARPEACWELELKMIEKQDADFHLRAPDEPEARAALLEREPERKGERDKLLQKVAPAQMELGAE
ncbi:MAG: BREX-1 system adenine-specific DNA-methyltransferase PglX [Sandaracinaceae bacterium]